MREVIVIVIEIMIVDVIEQMNILVRNEGKQVMS